MWKKNERNRWLKRGISGAAAFMLTVMSFQQPIYAEGTQPEESKEDAFVYAESREEIYEALKDLYRSYYQSKYYDYEYDYEDGLMGMEEATEDVAMDLDRGVSVHVPTAGSNSAIVSSDSLDFSETNIQEMGVDEGDIVKTDGSYIYILREDGTLVIIKADKGNSVVSSITDLKGEYDEACHEMYLDGDSLYVISGGYQTLLKNEDEYYFLDNGYQTRLTTYDISDREAPVIKGEVTQDGYYKDSRKNGEYVYLFTEFAPDIWDTIEESTLLPRINGEVAEVGDVYLPAHMRYQEYLVVSSVDTKQPDVIKDNKILVSGSTEYYVSAENIYIANEDYRTDNTRTDIVKFHYQDGEITGAAAGSVKGYINDSFSLNEYDGKLRVVTTYYGDQFSGIREVVGHFTGTYYSDNWEEHNALYVLDENLNRLGAITDLAEGETIRSARFFGDTGYFVTFRQTDPLFAVDLSDPKNPAILSELKVDGFSSYLHFYGEDLLGIGYDADPSSGVTTGLKLSMFDISDPADVKEADRFSISGITRCPAINNYKCILVQPEKNLIGFFCDNRYLLFSYDKEAGFQSEMVYDFYSDMLIGEADYQTVRGLYVGDTFYLAGKSFLLSFDMQNGYAKEGKLEF